MLGSEKALRAHMYSKNQVVISFFGVMFFNTFDVGNIG